MNKHQVKCELCNGAGVLESAAGSWDCFQCDGTGWLTDELGIAREEMARLKRSVEIALTGLDFLANSHHKPTADMAKITRRKMLEGR